MAIDLVETIGLLGRGRLSSFLGLLFLGSGGQLSIPLLQLRGWGYKWCLIGLLRDCRLSLIGLSSVLDSSTGIGVATIDGASLKFLISLGASYDAMGVTRASNATRSYFRYLLTEASISTPVAPKNQVSISHHKSKLKETTYRVAEASRHRLDLDALGRASPPRQLVS